MRGIRALLAAVIVMGVMILVGTAVLISTVVHRATQRAQSTSSGFPAGGPQGGPAPTLSLDQPPGTRVALVTRQSDSLLAVTLSGGGLPDRVLVWSPAAARIVARLALHR